MESVQSTSTLPRTFLKLEGVGYGLARGIFNCLACLNTGWLGYVPWCHFCIKEGSDIRAYFTKGCTDPMLGHYMSLWLVSIRSWQIMQINVAGFRLRGSVLPSSLSNAKPSRAVTKKLRNALNDRPKSTGDVYHTRV